MTHTESQDLLLDLAYGELPAHLAAEVEAHVQGCAECQREQAQLGFVRAQMAPIRALEEPSDAFDGPVLAAAKAGAQLEHDGNIGQVIEVAASAAAPAIEPRRIDAHAARARAAGPRRPRWSRWLVGGSAAAAAALALVVGTSLSTKREESPAKPQKELAIRIEAPKTMGSPQSFEAPEQQGRTAAAGENAVATQEPGQNAVATQAPGQNAIAAQTAPTMMAPRAPAGAGAGGDVGGPQGTSAHRKLDVPGGGGLGALRGGAAADAAEGSDEYGSAGGTSTIGGVLGGSGPSGTGSGASGVASIGQMKDRARTDARETPLERASADKDRNEAPPPPVAAAAPAPAAAPLAPPAALAMQQPAASASAPATKPAAAAAPQAPAKAAAAPPPFPEIAAAPPSSPAQIAAAPADAKDRARAEGGEEESRAADDALTEKKAKGARAAEAPAAKAKARPAASDTKATAQQAESARHAGNYALAASLYQTAASEAADPSVAAWDLAHAVECLSAAGDFAGARKVRDRLAADYGAQKPPLAAAKRALREVESSPSDF